LKAERHRLSSRRRRARAGIKQCEVIIARATRSSSGLTKLRSEVMLQTFCAAMPPLVARGVGQLGPQFQASLRAISAALTTWAREGLGNLRIATR